jgi:glycosyltransferase involved in cell wall biosynthesis
MRKARRLPTIEGNYRNWTSLAAYREDSRQARQLLHLVRSPSGPVAGIRLFSAMRNERDILPLFLDHYRKLGVARFVIVDNDSSDGSRELLLDQPDVELHHTAASYAAANAGSLWIDALLEEQAGGRWIAYADADELLVYDGCDRHPLPALAGRLDALGETKLLAPLLDVYSHPATPQDLLFDALPEQWHNTGRSPHITGGPRCRMAAAIDGAQPPALTKYPLVRYGPRVSFVNVHFPEPRRENSNRIRGRLLHLKLTPRFRGKVAEALREGQHWNEGSEYLGYAKWLDDRDIGDLVIADSRRYLGPADLIEAGLLEPLDWRRSNASLRIKRALRRLF